MTLLELHGAGFAYGSRRVLDDVSLSIDEGDSLGLVGESGAGKSTILRLLLGLATPLGGQVLFEGTALSPRDRAQMRRFRASVQPIFQDPYSSLDPRQRIDRIVGEPLRSLGLASGADAQRRISEALDAVGLPADTARRYPHEFSGGQRQRIAIARAVVSRPRALLADEPVSALDVTTRVQVLELLDRLRRENGLSLVMVSHDLTAIASACDRTVVLKDGRVVEQGATSDVLHAPQDPYTRALVDAVPRLPR
ncbi:MULTISPECIES: ABC transporter ATP-binding protein [Microbacterium]|uniref:Oligopeptide transport ATP-binding protein OppF n=1 Tax=Microbacterium oxydans TaxID=82380 RepID=A0A3Q9J6H4_9MICO|nr:MULTISPECIES: ABC transporter ATP-binding protein [Microbacterium]AZS42431.1 Oligopeptide transport ATP-binding protein OppF [Microbacterium oxydans]KKX97303.1 peptide ABC transporter ATP-binding protein [Microbacterium sp. Ag1]